MPWARRQPAAVLSSPVPHGICQIEEMFGTQVDGRWPRARAVRLSVFLIFACLLANLHFYLSSSLEHPHSFNCCISVVTPCFIF